MRGPTGSSAWQPPIRLIRWSPRPIRNARMVRPSRELPIVSPSSRDIGVVSRIVSIRSYMRSVIGFGEPSVAGDHVQRPLLQHNDKLV